MNTLADRLETLERVRGEEHQLVSAALEALLDARSEPMIVLDLAMCERVSNEAARAFFPDPAAKEQEMCAALDALEAPAIEGPRRGAIAERLQSSRGTPVGYLIRMAAG